MKTIGLIGGNVDTYLDPAGSMVRVVEQTRFIALRV